MPQIITLLKILRPHQWIKNLLVFVPLIANRDLFTPSLVMQSLLVFVIFCLGASSVYIVNDLLDIKNDRKHPTKKFRPIPAGKISIPLAVIIAVLLLAGGVFLSIWFFNNILGLLLLGYFLLSLSYSLWLKKIAIIDIIILSLFYLWRVMMGGVALDITITFWLVIFTLFLFFSLSCVKRYIEIYRAKNVAAYKNIQGRGYSAGDDIFIMLMGMASSFAAVVILCLYFHENASYHFAYAYIIILLLWLNRLWFLSHKNLVHDDPLVFAVKDKWSLLMFLLMGILVVIDMKIAG
ncbi:MAG: UbiA family prenyltransferase [Hydrotalea sp.]|nr:UbiA family prenyltransferase [Hydrotalea sp.]